MKHRLPRPLHESFDWNDKYNRQMRRKHAGHSAAWYSVHRIIKVICPGHLRRTAIRLNIGTR